MKITLYYPDGTGETFRDCETVDDSFDQLTFRGTNWRDNRVYLETTLPYTIDFEDPKLVQPTDAAVSAFVAEVKQVSKLVA